MQRYYYLLIFSFNIIFLFAQQRNLDSIKDIIEESYNKCKGDFINEIVNLIEEIDEHEIKDENDLVKYHYYYSRLLCDIRYHKIDSLSYLPYLNKAIELREKSVGVLHPEYLELLAYKGEFLEVNDILSAQSAYRKAIVVGLNQIKKGDISYNKIFGILLDKLGNIYEKRNYKNLAISLYRLGYDILKEEFNPDNYWDYCWFPMYRLYALYFYDSEYDLAIKTCDNVLEFYNINNANPSIFYSKFLYYKALVYKAQEKIDDSLLYLRNSIQMMDLLDYVEETDSYNSLSQLYILYNEKSDINGMREILPQILNMTYSEENPKIIGDMLHYSSDICRKNNNIEGAKYNLENLIKFPEYLKSQNIDIDMMYSSLSYCCLIENNIEEAIKFQEKAINSSLTPESEFRNRFGLISIKEVKDSTNVLEEYKLLKNEMEKKGMIESLTYQNIITSIVSYIERQNKYEDCLEFLLYDYENIESKFGHNHQLCSLYDSLIGAYYIFLNDGTSALPFLLERKSYLEKSNNVDTYDYALVLHNLGATYIILNDTTKAVDYLKESKDLQLKVIGTVMEQTEINLKGILDK